MLLAITTVICLKQQRSEITAYSKENKVASRLPGDCLKPSLCTMKVFEFQVHLAYKKESP